MSVATLEVGRIVGGNPDGLIRPNDLLPAAKALPPVIYGHGSGGNAAFPLTGDGVGSRALLEELADVGFVIAIPSTYGFWGNTSGDAAWTAAIAFARAQGAHATKRAILIGASMGGASSLRYASLHPEAVAAVVGFIPAVDWDALITADTLGLRSVINVAYGRSSGDTSPLGAGISPAANAAALAQVHQQLWYASDDTVSVNIGTYAATCGLDLHSVGALGHSAAAIAAANSDEVVRYMLARSG